MPVANAYVLHGINLGSGEFISQLSDGGVVPDLEEMMFRSAGQPGPGFRGARSAAPKFNFSSTQVNTILGLTGAVSGGFAWKDLTAGNTDLFFKKITPYGTRVADAATSHKRVRAAKAMLVVNRLRAGHRQDASVDATIHTNYDGTNLPVVAAGSVALAGTSTADQAFGLGPIYLNGTVLGGEQDMDFSTGVVVEELHGASEPYTTLLAIREYNAEFTITCLDDATLETVVPAQGLAVSSFVAYLRKKTANGLYVANATTQHISLTAASTGYAYLTRVSGGDNRTSQAALKVCLNGLVTIATNAAIP